MMQNNDTAISGSITDVMDDVEVGSDIRVLADGYAATMNSVQLVCGVGVGSMEFNIHVIENVDKYSQRRKTQ
ncbi:hypothetical protein DPMN_183185, partial [Dreissena polymorpha]